MKCIQARKSRTKEFNLPYFLNFIDFITEKVERLCNLSMPSEGNVDEIDAIKQQQQQKQNGGKYEVTTQT